MMKIKSFKLFESVDTDELLSIVKDMLRELDFNDFSHNAVIRRMDGKEFIRITIYKPAIRNQYAPYTEDSFKWNDVKGVMVPVMDYLSEEGFEWFKDKGTSHTENVPRVVSRGSYLNNQYNTKIEMWFLRI